MKRISIECLVRWAWIEELSKVEPDRDFRDFRAPAALGYSNGWVALTGAGRVGASAVANRFGAVYDRSIDREIDPDAIRIAEAVAALDDLVVEEPAEIDWFGTWGDLGRLGDDAMSRAWGLVVREAKPDAAGGAMILQGRASSTVVRTAIVGHWPDWRGVAPSVVPDLHPGGQPKWRRMVERAVGWDGAGVACRFELVEADGFNRSARRPFPGAWQVERLVPDPARTLAARIRWAMIHAWFSSLAAKLDGIGGRVVLPPDRPAAPWID